jgi:hypothetical protein
VTLKLKACLSGALEKPCNVPSNSIYASP